jgi:farnesyl-diphosphate farnesyltransferase
VALAAAAPVPGLTALQALEATSRTFYLPIIRLPAGVREAVTSAYLCLRAIDEIEDHPALAAEDKVRLLTGVSLALQAQEPARGFDEGGLEALFAPFVAELPAVTLDLARWAMHAPEGIAARIWNETAAMADRMAHWVAVSWRVRDEADLNRYTYAVAGSVGVLLSDIWAWNDGTRTHHGQAVGYGRGLQAVNILLNRQADAARGVSFFPPDWEPAQMHAYARRQLAQAQAYVESLPPGPIRDACRIPAALAAASLEALERGERKLSRPAVLAVLARLAVTKDGL